MRRGHAGRGRRLALASAVSLALGGATGADGETIWIHASASTDGGPGRQVSLFRAFTTADEAGTERVRVARLCIRGVGHQAQERCEENASAVELEERATGLTGLALRCVEAIATAVSRVGPLSAQARACP